VQTPAPAAKLTSIGKNYTIAVVAGGRKMAGKYFIFMNLKAPLSLAVWVH